MSILPSLARGTTSSSKCLARLATIPSRKLHLLSSTQSFFQPPSSTPSSFLRAQRHSSSRPPVDEVLPSTRPPHLDFDPLDGLPEQDQDQDQDFVRKVNRDAPPPPPTPEEKLVAELRALKSSLGRNLKGDEISPNLVVRAYLPDDPRPRPPVVYSSVFHLPEFQALLPTHTPVLVRLAVADPDDVQSYSLVRVFETEALEQMEIEQKTKLKETARAQALLQKPGALGPHSGLRNQGHYKELQGTWVMADNDLHHRVKQMRDYLLNSEKVTLELKPKKYGKKVKVSDEQKEVIVDKVVKMVEDIAERSQPDKVNVGGGSTTL